MWKNYSIDYIKNNRAGSYSIMTASFIAALFLSFLSSLFYHFWLDSVREAEKETPVFLLSFYMIVLALMCLSLILIIHNSFTVSMNSRIHQFGIFSSIGATPGQILACLLQEAFMLAALPILLGSLLGILCSFLTVRGMSAFAVNLAGGREMEFALHPAIPVFILLLSFLTVLISAWIPAKKLCRLTPLEAIRGTGELQLAKKKQSRILSVFFGVEGELAGNALKAQRKTLRTTSVSLVFAFLGFMLMQCFFTLSSISTGHTYFEAFQDAWDVMVTVKNTKIEEFDRIKEIQKIQGIDSGVIYQKAEAVCILPIRDISPELLEAGGLEAIAGISMSAAENAYPVEAPLVILDDESFAEYCEQIGVVPQLGGSVVLNRIWDSAGSNFRYPEYLPYIKGGTDKITLRCVSPAGEGAENMAEGLEAEISGKTAAGSGTEISAGLISELTTEIPVLACTQTPPVLREEYEKSEYPLVQFISLSLWRETAGKIGEAQEELYIRILAGERASFEALNALEDQVLEALGGDFETESENRIQEKTDNDRMIMGYQFILGGLCVLLAIIGIAHVFSNTSGFLRQRKREFARYMSVGLTPKSIWKMFLIEAAVVVGRPVLAALALTTVAAGCMIKMSYLDPMEFMRAAPVAPILAFILAVSGAVALAYYLGGKKILRITLAEALRDDTML